ncbi:IL16 protein, partial [Acromyrmex charruanus]
MERKMSVGRRKKEKVSKERRWGMGDGRGEKAIQGVKKKKKKKKKKKLRWSSAGSITTAAGARDDEADRVSKIAEYTEEESKNPNKARSHEGTSEVGDDTVNGKMENCGGGQRLPPDGDEFPAAYQEFNNSSNQPPYRYISTTRTTTITTNDAGLCNENESFRTNETVKMLTNDSNVVSSRSIILSDSKITFPGTENVRQDINKVALASIESVRSEVGKATSSNVDNIYQDVKSTEITNEEKKSSYHTSEDIAKKNTSIVAGSSLYSCQTTTSNLIMSEKKMEIAGYYHKAVTTLEEVPSHVEKDAPIDTPPPLPLTGPPKIEQVLHTRITPTIESPQRKFSLNGDLWRQDDKSERSVRDKIAMFSSQSNLDAPLFPNAITAAAATSNSKRLSKYKSSEDVCCDDKSNGQKDRPSSFADRTQSSFDLTDSAKTMTGHDSAKKYNQRTLSLPQTVQPALLSPTTQTTRTPKTLPIVPPKSLSNPLSTFNSIKPTTPSTPSLTRATSFSGPAPFVQDRDSLTTDSISNSQISRTNSLASTFRRPGEDVRRNSLNQMIEQRRRSISKLRGLVIPEKDTVSIDQPIVDLPEIKSRDSILLHQIPKANIQDKWGSQSSLASNASTASQPVKATTSFKMPAPQIYSKYSPAFKRKSLTVCGTSVTTNSTINGSSPIKSSQSTAMSTFSEPPKSLESICSPTRSDYSFEFASTTSSPDGSRTRPRIMQRKARLDYDDSDNDSAVSSSQSSISRGFSPPMSPVPSERSTISSERSYVSAELNCQRRPLIADNLSRISVARDIRDQIAASDKDQFTSRIGVLGERTYLAERSSSSSSGSNPRSPQPNEFVSRSSQIPQRQLRRSNSTDTNCSTSSTLTSGSQASAESLSRRVLKPQSVEAINRKNILASARCRSGRDLNGSPLIQRKFSDDEDAVKETVQNGGAIHQISNNSGSDPASKQEIKIAYIEVADPFAEDEESLQKNEEKPKLPPKMSFPPPAVRPPKSEMLEPSNDLKMWVRAEVKTLARSMEEKSRYDKNPILAAQNLETRNSRGSIFNQPAITASNNDLSSKNRTTVSDMKVTAMEMSKSQSKANSTPRKNMEDQNDLLTILTTKSRSRSAIHVDEGTFGRSKSQMSLEDILGAKPDLKLSRAQNTEPKIEKNGIIPSSPVKSAWEISKENRYGRRGSITSNESLSEDRPFVSKIPTLGRTKTVDSGDEMTESVERIKSVTASKIPTSRGLNRRSASVTDMKKALEKVDTNPTHNQSQQNTSNTHNRFPSLDSSVDENIGAEIDTDRCYGEQFGSISSLASSTSLISQQELAQLVEEASLEEARGAHDVIVVLLHKENPTGSVGITLAGGADCEVKEITVHRVLTHSIADKDGRVQRGDRILSINGRSTRGLTHRESMAVLKQPRSEVVLVVSRVRMEEGCKLRSRTASVETIVEGLETNGNVEDTAWGPPSTVAVYKGGAGLGFSLEGGRDSPLGDRPLIIKKIFTGGAAEKTGALKAGDQLLEVNGNDVTRMSRIEAWSLMKKLHDGEVNLLVRHPATKSS